MDNDVKFSSKLCSTKSAKGGTDRSKKVDIKGICQKFENLSSSAEKPVNFREAPTPVAPVRRKRLSLNGGSIKNSDISNAKFVPSDVNFMTPATYSQVTPASVKERTKIFESPVAVQQRINSSNSKLIKNTGKVPTVTENSPVLQSGLTKRSENVVLESINPPPAKPPRSFQHTEFNSENNLCFETSKSNSVVVPKDKLSVKSEFKTNNVTSFSNRTKSEGQDEKMLKRSSVPEILIENNDKTPQSTPKQVILSCLKNISSTANNIREKVKQKHTNIFVDLTPTTVSPPKHYGTLKRSLSEEHIYAEPADVFNLDPNRLSSPKSVEPLHYMCTSLVPPAVPHKEKTEDEKFTSSVSVRNMIYGSFAGLRTVPKGSMENVSNSSVTDSTEADVSVKAIEDRIIYVKSVRKQVSSSSICLAPKLYEALFIINVIENQPQVMHSFPLKVNAEYNIPLLPHICFPHGNLWKSVSVYQSEVFHFSLIEKNETIFGYCLRIQGWPDTKLSNEPLCVKLPVAVCILSSFSAPVFYRKLLLEVENHLTLPRNNCFKYIRSLQKLGVPNAGASLSIPDCSEQNPEANRIIISRPLDSHFVGSEMTRTLQLLDVDILVKCVASLFLERRILFFSTSTSNLYHTCKAITSLLYPFEWPHLIVPVLPVCLTIHCCSEQPYILGIVNNCESVLELLAEHELLIIDVDKGTIIKSCNDEDTILPRKVQKAVISALNLAKNMTDPTEMLRDIMISEAFVHMSVEMIGHYENHFTDTNGTVTFQKESFLRNAVSCNIRSFLQWFTETQMFDTFIEDSIWRIKYRTICQTSMRTFFEKRVDEYKWELSHSGEKFSRFIGKTVRNFGEMLKGLKKS